MNIKSRTTCWTPRPETSWSAGEIREVADKVGEKLLKNNNFVKVSETKPEIGSGKEENDQHRKKRRFRDRP